MKMQMRNVTKVFSRRSKLGAPQLAVQVIARQCTLESFYNWILCPALILLHLSFFRL